MASAGGATPEEATPAGGSLEGSSCDLAARDAEATESEAAAGEAAVDGAGAAAEEPRDGESGVAKARQGWGLFGLRVDEVPALA